MLKSKTEKFVDVQDFDALVEETYGKPYKFQQQNGCQARGVYYLTVPDPDAADFEDDEIPEVINGQDRGVSFTSWLKRNAEEWNGAPEDKRSLHLFWNRNFYPAIEVLANDLHSKGLIEAGEYVINIDW